MRFVLVMLVLLAAPGVAHASAGGPVPPNQGGSGVALPDGASCAI